MHEQQTRPEPDTRRGKTSSGREHEPAQDHARSAARPIRRARARDFTGINPQDREPIDPSSPLLPAP